MYDENNTCLSWDETVEYARMIFETDDAIVPVIYKGEFNQEAIQTAYDAYKSTCLDGVEGYVVRLSNSFKYEDFSRSVAKYVRSNHVQTDTHWTKCWTPNCLVGW